MSVKLCRCCLSVGLHKDLNIPYFNLENKEVYSDMLLECFNIVLSTDETNNMICESCITSLRSSLTFKRQVIKAEEDFIEWIEKQDKVTAEVKEELKEDSGTESDDYFLADADKQEIKTEQPQSDESDNLSDTLNEEQDTEVYKERLKRKTKKTEDGNWQSKKIKTLVNRLTNSLNTRDVTDLKLKEKKSKKSSNQNDRNVIVWSTRKNTNNFKNKENLKTLLQFSNVIPFKNRTLLGYICGYCEEIYQDPQELRNHTKENHQKERLDFAINCDMSENNVKLDVTDLKCTNCELELKNLTDFKTHLVKLHNKFLHNDIKNHIQEYKLKNGDIYDCALCSATYETFKMLKQHMNNHYDNYTCNKCHSTFATKRSLRSHKTTHIEGSYKCDDCDKIFSSKAKKVYHEKCKHLGERKISNCQYCNESFRSYYQRNKHLVKVHNTEAKYKCNICSKSYVIKSLLMSHIKKNHLMERNCQCTECGFKFFSKKGLKAHMVKHSGVKKFSCEFCHKSYARKNTLREHLRIHNNDRRFKCDICAVAFVQKCSLKSHLLSNHGISMAASDILSS
ncbi:PREDICTED: zinc finger protein draculin-like isoform X2 [Papilio polytes]|uniref:zinc finger protein draculin-like isoform X2 n=1 Tax=Papilio polytes TaxID=76194 RepID=UPI0006769A85|nr:PREDICTED: zinc finger protein draculin-like isoform X2 [Papilio polytes]